MRSRFFALVILVSLFAGSANAAVVSFSKLTGTTGDSGGPATAVYKADLSTSGLANALSLTITDSGVAGGSAPGQFTGFDMDAVIISSTNCDTAACVEALISEANLNYENANLSPGAQVSPEDTKLYGTNLTGDGVDNSVATLGSFDAVSSTVSPFGFISLGTEGSIGFDFERATNLTSPLYAYVGEVGDNGELVEGGIEVLFASAPKQNAGSQGASVITAFRNYVEGAQNTDSTYLERIDECAAQGPNCDFDAVANDQEFQQNLRNAADATYASKDLVTRTSLTSQNAGELIVDSPNLLSEIKAIFQWIGLLPEDEGRDKVINASVEGERGQFTVNPTFESLFLTYIIDFEGQSFFDGLLGEAFLFNKSLTGKEYYAGYGIVDSVVDLGNGNQRVVFSISQLESDDAFMNDIGEVPLPAGFYLFLSGLFGLGWLKRKRH